MRKNSFGFEEIRNKRNDFADNYKFFWSGQKSPPEILVFLVSVSISWNTNREERVGSLRKRYGNAP
jgi:hypothetical protein